MKLKSWVFLLVGPSNPSINMTIQNWALLIYSLNRPLISGQEKAGSSEREDQTVWDVNSWVLQASKQSLHIGLGLATKQARLLKRMEFQHEAIAFEKEQTRQDWYLNWISGRIGLKFTSMSEMGHKKENKLNWHGGRPPCRKKLLYQTPLWFSSEHGWASACSGTPAAVGARDFWAGGSAWGGNCIKWLMRPFAETCRIWSSFAMHSICRISIRNSSKQFTTCPPNSKKQLMSWFLDVSWYSWFWLAFCFSGLMHLCERCSKRVGWRTWSSRRRLIQSKRRAEQDAARSLRACKSWVFDISKWAYT